MIATSLPPAPGVASLQHVLSLPLWPLQMERRPLLSSRERRGIAHRTAPRRSAGLALECRAVGGAGRRAGAGGPVVGLCAGQHS